jgi:PIN domain nuclease of toxin-antitoxin system
LRVLLDTHVFLWLQSEPERVGDHLDSLRDPDTERLVSAVVPWEIAVKYQSRRLALPEPPSSYMPRRMREIRGTALPIEQAHTLELATLPLIHRDPFDRMLVAQARLLGVPIMTADAAIAAYPVETIMV